MRAHSQPESSPNHTVYEAVTKRITDALVQGVVPWRKPWRDPSFTPQNGITKRPYHGVNLFLLGLSPFRDFRWLTFPQVQSLGGKIRKGEKSSIAVFWKQWAPGQSDEEAAERRRTVPLLRYYHLFNAEQCSDLDLPVLPHHIDSSVPERIQHAEGLVQGIPNPPQVFDQCKSAWYQPSSDTVGIPPLASFTTADGYYATLFHEFGHATGHESRLNRPGVVKTSRFGSTEYSQEELIAEFTSAFCCSALGLDNSLTENAAAYIGGWLKALADNPKAIVMAAGAAQRAADYIRGISPQGTRP